MIGEDYLMKLGTMENSPFGFPEPIIRQPKTTVLCYGCWDLLHYGHLIHLQEARALGDILIIGLTADEFVNKGPGRPCFNTFQRKAMLEALAIVDAVHICYTYGPEELIAQIKPDFYVKGKEYKGVLKEQGMVEGYGGKVIFTFDEIASKIHSTDLIANARKTP